MKPELASVVCPECDWSPDESFAAYCHECGTRTEVDATFENPGDTITDKI